MRLTTATVGPLAGASATSIVATTGGSTAAGTAFTLTTSPYVMDKPRRVLITSAGTDTTVIFSIVGRDWNGTPVSELLTGGSSGSPVYSVYDYSTVISVTPTVNNTASTNSVGTNGIASTRPIFLDEYAFAPTALQVSVTGTVSATVRQSLQDPTRVGYTSVAWLNHPDTNLVNLVGTVQGNYAYMPKVVQLVLNSGTGSAELAVIQAAMEP